MNIFNLFHLVGAFKKINDYLLLVFNRRLFFKKLMCKAYFLLPILLDISFELFNLITSFYDKILKVNVSLLKTFDLLVNFTDLGEERLFSQLLVF